MPRSGLLFSLGLFLDTRFLHGNCLRKEGTVDAPAKECFASVALGPAIHLHRPAFEPWNSHPGYEALEIHLAEKTETWIED